MRLKLKLTKDEFDALPDDEKVDYKEFDEEYFLDLPDIDDHPSVKNLKSAHERVKGDKTGLKNQLDELRAKVAEFDGVDLNEIDELRQKAEQAENKELDLDDEQVKALVERRYAPARQALEKERDVHKTRADEALSAIDELQTRLDDVTIFGALEQAALDKGARKRAIPDIKARARGVWRKHEDGDYRAFKSDGELWFGKDGERLTHDGWLEVLADEVPFLFETNRGVGAQGGESVGQTGVQTIDYSDGRVSSSDMRAIREGKAVRSE